MDAVHKAKSAGITSSLRLLLLLSAVFAASGMLATQARAEQGVLEPRALIEALRRGGLILYFRHAKTDHSQIDLDRDNLENCENQRNLAEVGREQARRIGQAIRDLGIPIGQVLSSPYCRCRDTATLAFGRVETKDFLRFGMGEDQAETEEMAWQLRLLLSSPTQSSANDVIVSHTANLKEAVGIWPMPEGAAYVFRPVEGGSHRYLGHIAPDRWGRLASGSQAD